MKIILTAFLCALSLSPAVFAQGDIRGDAGEIIQETKEQIQELTDELYYRDRYVLILESSEDYNEAVNFAVEAGAKLGIKFNNEGREYSKEKGIYFAQDYAEQRYRGKYCPRSAGQDFISLENASAYRGLGAGYIIVVAGVFKDKESAARALAKVKGFYADAFVANIAIWTGPK